MSTSGLASVTVLAVILLIMATAMLMHYRHHMKPKKMEARVRVDVPRRRYPYKSFLMLSGTILAGTMAVSMPTDVQANAGWSATTVFKVSSQAADTASAASTAEEILAAPNHPDFLKLRNYLTRQLVDSEKFDQFPSPVLVDLSKHRDKETIKYLVTQRPGIMSVIYYSQQQGHQLMLVYWPELSGEQVIFTPLSGFVRNNPSTPLTSAH
ncbi:hypothetical protein BTA51_06080 [Hahella sp. CCB-MM4]|uniref:hypothetical protein n=1 Tax=Hahella sp. (strain CCB-MM4) TaxID=1926491 RepID=UPI000B9BE2C1|nr:hypothetical protein [Hahella sp. CCB-MM4]OZG74563.1 hypothetical protein BTA51_06080 [Hahella sp. CCB-MM4]